MGFSRQGYWSGLPLPSPGDLPDPGIEPGSPALQADALTSEPAGKPLSILLTQNCLTILKVSMAQVVLVVKNLLANAEDIRSLGPEDPLEGDMATHSSILA